MSVDSLINERLREHMFPNELACWELISKSNIKSDLIRYQITRYDYYSFIHGSGKDFIGTPQYNSFMNEKWSFVLYDLQVANSLNGYKEGL